MGAFSFRPGDEATRLDTYILLNVLILRKHLIILVLDTTFQDMLLARKALAFTFVPSSTGTHRARLRGT